MGETASEYNGWANHATWNVALWIGNDEGLYITARECESYAAFVYAMQEMGGEGIAYQTPDGVSWGDSGLDTDALDELISELGE